MRHLHPAIKSVTFHPAQEPTPAHIIANDPNGQPFTWEDSNLIHRIVDRACAAFPTQVAPRRIHLTCALIDIQESSYALDLPAFATAGLSNFAHDIGGILRHWDYLSGTFSDCFLPRFARR